ncbi:FAD-dependent oxidoreductase [Novosphingobium profundi]|uniref:FAD-dependent oxidoreductase n=1 Tax=Novosphingobium profundi TaxID=1774954 RepID=UPI001CFC682A|nr:FAD-dependent oxidoreductase [Novosphingobium profundi]
MAANGSGSAGAQDADILIIGGGIAGLTAALGLIRQGRKVRLFEQADAFGDVGAGITLSQPASRGLFSLGLREAIEAAADIPVRAGGADWRTGERLGGPDQMAIARERGDIPYFYQLHRADMHAILADAVAAADPEAITLGAQMTRLEQDASGVTAHFADGSCVRAPILAGADGINSRVRAELFGEENPRFTGQVAYRFLIPFEDVSHHMHLGPSVNYLGPNRQVLVYRIRHGAVVNGVAFVKTDSWIGEGWSTPADVEELLEKFEGWNADVRGLIASAPREGTRKWALFDRDPLPQWTVGRVTLMGDAAHPMLPFLGLGAAMGIEDAVVFARSLGETADPVAALQRYEATRRERANWVLLASRKQGEINQSGDTSRRGKPDPRHETLMTYDPATTEIAAFA